MRRKDCFCANMCSSHGKRNCGMAANVKGNEWRKTHICIYGEKKTISIHPQTEFTNFLVPFIYLQFSSSSFQNNPAQALWSHIHNTHSSTCTSTLYV